MTMDFSPWFSVVNYKFYSQNNWKLTSLKWTSKVLLRQWIQDGTLTPEY